MLTLPKVLHESSLGCVSLGLRAEPGGDENPGLQSPSKPQALGQFQLWTISAAPGGHSASPSEVAGACRT